MEETENFVWVRHVADPGICGLYCQSKCSVFLFHLLFYGSREEEIRILTPRRISKSIPEPSQHENNDEDRIRRVHRNNDVRDEMARRRYNRNASLAELEMDAVVQ